MEEPQLSLTEYAVLGVLAEGPTHGFAISRDLAPKGSVGRVLTVRRPLTYRALDRLVSVGLATPVHSERGDGGPQRLVHKATPAGKRRLKRWLGEPVWHVRDMRIEFQLKLVLLQRSGSSPLALIEKQRRLLGPTLVALDIQSSDPPDLLELWRQHNAAATDGYLKALEDIYTT
ncbi:MAG TPA: helix-turn-helix transcriptional regulator [Acidimicrobiia bacterium]